MTPFSSLILEIWTPGFLVSRMLLLPISTSRKLALIPKVWRMFSLVCPNRFETFILRIGASSVFYFCFFFLVSDHQLNLECLYNYIWFVWRFKIYCCCFWWKWSMSKRSAWLNNDVPLVFENQKSARGFVENRPSTKQCVGIGGYKSFVRFISQAFGWRSVLLF